MDRLDRGFGDRVIALPRLEEVMIVTDRGSPIILALCLPSVRGANMRLTGGHNTSSALILPAAFEERLPSFQYHTRGLFHTQPRFAVEFFGLHQS